MREAAPEINPALHDHQAGKKGIKLVAQPGGLRYIYITLNFKRRNCLEKLSAFGFSLKELIEYEHHSGLFIASSPRSRIKSL